MFLHFFKFLEPLALRCFLIESGINNKLIRIQNFSVFKECAFRVSWSVKTDASGKLQNVKKV